MSLKMQEVWSATEGLFKRPLILKRVITERDSNHLNCFNCSSRTFFCWVLSRSSIEEKEPSFLSCWCHQAVTLQPFVSFFFPLFDHVVVYLLDQNPRVQFSRFSSSTIIFSLLLLLFSCIFPLSNVRWLVRLQIKWLSSQFHPGG